MGRDQAGGGGGVAVGSPSGLEKISVRRKEAKVESLQYEVCAVAICTSTDLDQRGRSKGAEQKTTHVDVFGERDVRDGEGEVDRAVGVECPEALLGQREGRGRSGRRILG